MNILFTLLLGCTDTTKLEQKLSAIEVKLSAIDEKRVIVDYKVVRVNARMGKYATSTLEKKINEEIKQGWQPLGNWHRDSSGVGQTLVKYKTTETK